MIETSIICIVTNDELYNNMVESLTVQTYQNFEVIKIENYSNKYNDATKALNIGAEKAKGEYLVFLHQDIVFVSPDSLFNIIKLAKKIKNYAILGVAGCPLGDYRRIYTNIFQGVNKEESSSKIEKEMLCQTVDECFFIVKKSYWKNHKFSANLKGFHLYAVEFCLRALANGDLVYTLPADVWHYSKGASLNYVYYIKLKKILKEYSDTYKIINTTVAQWKTTNTQQLILNYYIIRNYIHNKIKKLIL